MFYSRIVVLSIFLFLAFACSEKEIEPVRQPQPVKTEVPPKKPLFTNYEEHGDIDALERRGKIRLVALRSPDHGLPREGLAFGGYRQLAEEFVLRLGLKVQWVFVDTFKELIPTLREGKGDVVVAHLTQTDRREQLVAFSLPLSKSEEQVINFKPDKPLAVVSDLAGKEIVVAAGSSYLESLENIKNLYPDVDFNVIAKKDAIDFTQGLHKLKSNSQITVLDSDVIDSLVQYNPDLQRGLTISETRPISWAVRKNAPKLLAKLNQFLTASEIIEQRNKVFLDDFPGISKRKTLRVITRNSPATYFMWRGELMGFEYELIKKFADNNNVRLEVVVAPPGVDMLDLLVKGKGDIVASALTITEERKTDKVSFTVPYNKVNEQFATANSTPNIESIDQLNGRTLFIKRSHAYWETAQHLLKQGAKFTLVDAPDKESSAEILYKVSTGEYDATLVDSHLLAIESKFLNNLSPGLKLDPAREHGWAVRKNNPLLFEKLNRYIKKNYRGRYFNIVYNKYYKNERRIDKYQGQRLSAGDQLSPYDNLVKPHAQQYHFDWRMVVSQMYQESQFDPEAKSFAGALGLLQVMPKTALELGYSIPFTPELGIRAGIEYLDWTRDRFENHLPINERLWFSLAAYNAGFGHVRDARGLASKKGWNPDKWFGNVENAMLLLSKKEYYRQARFGYVRGSEPVNYVKDIRERYYAYLELVSNE